VNLPTNGGHQNKAENSATDVLAKTMLLAAIQIRSRLDINSAMNFMRQGYAIPTPMAQPALPVANAGDK
jgi:hypothetical protein